MTGRLVLAARLTLLFGTLVALAGLAGFWLWPAAPTVRLNTVQQALLGIEPDDFHVSFLVAGRDILYAYSRSDPVYDQAGNIICWRPNGTRSIMGVNTDTIVYASLRNGELTMVAIPRDLFLGEGTRKINQVIGTSSGAEGLRAAVEEVLGLPVDYYVIINLEIFQNLVDDLGGVQVNVPQRMRHYDCTGGLDIDLQPGLQWLDGKQASDFIRFRSLPRGDLDRLENMERLALAALSRVRELNVAGVGRVPAIIGTLLNDVETDLTPNDLTALLPRIGDVNLGAIATLPVHLEWRGNTDGVVHDPAEVEWFLANLFGGTARTFAAPPGDTVLITNRSGSEEALTWYVERLEALGVPPGLIVVREGEPDANPTRVVATLDALEAAGYYAHLLNTGVQSVSRIGNVEGALRHIELVLGDDALERLAPQQGVPAWPANPREAEAFAPAGEH